MKEIIKQLIVTLQTIGLTNDEIINILLHIL